MSFPDLLFCLLSLMGLALVPASLGRNAWAFPAGFGAVAFFVLVAPARVHPAANPWIALALSQGGWILLALDLVARGRVSREVDRVSMRELVAFSLVHLVALRHLVAAARGDLPPLFALEMAFSALLLSAGALLLWAVCRPGNAVYRGFLAFWNAVGLISTLESGWRIQRAAPGFFLGGWSRPSAEVHGYFTGWPAALDAFFWIPLAISIHLAIFYKLVRGVRPVAPAAAPLR